VAAIGTVDLSGFGAALAAAVALPVDYGPLLRKVAIVLRSDVLRCFDESRSPDGTPWAPLKPQTVRRRRGGGGGAKPLRDTGILMLSATAAGARGHVERLTATSLVFGSNLNRAQWHQGGTKTIPARPFVGLSQRAVGIIESMCADFAAQRLGKPVTLPAPTFNIVAS
jgi:phage virion morphogenesis protein